MGKRKSKTPVKIKSRTKKADLIMKTSDFELLVKKLRSLNVSEVRIRQIKGDADFNAIDFDFNSSGRISFFSLLGDAGGVAHMFYEEPYGTTEDLLDECRPLQIYINEYGE
jgi:hypothetical protein